MTQLSAHLPVHQRDPLRWTLALTALFGALALVRIAIPTQPMFDEIHYLPAARAFLELSQRVNPEHPPFGKEMIAAGIWLLGDNAWGWRIAPWAFGVLGLFAGMRAMWFASGTRFASLATGFLLATAFPLFIQTRIAMLDVFMISLTLVAMWHWAGAMRENETARWRLPLVGLALGLAMASKWNAIPVAVLPGLAFLAWRAWHSRLRLLTARRAPPIRGVSLLEAGLWLGVVPVLVYWAAYWPMWLLSRDAVPWNDPLEWHRHMLSLQHQLLKAHRYQSVWWQWVLDLRAIWYLYQEVDGAQRGVILVGNLVTMWLGLPALLWCAFVGVFKRRWDALAVAAGYAASLGLWMITAKNIQFYYHYGLPSCFLAAALALAMDALWRRGGRWRWPVYAALAAILAVFVLFWPVLTAAPLEGKQDFLKWTWLEAWR
ncbi:MAG: hypothetical protein B7Z08_02995 [Sphingomonadales bacterium 32-68-7]|nr:MAG: hypothetical protein B7Z33_12985 [Sphingomonadales bacterium 12-68-11]OYX10013.1 MAG: hypothetical protein B7Z08_02995 [Sphingomonadales bacterium 32-68-7]